jgi:hypothetical protein
MQKMPRRYTKINLRLYSYKFYYTMRYSAYCEQLRSQQSIQLIIISRYYEQKSSLILRAKVRKIAKYNWRHRGSNAGPLDLQSNALPTELWHRICVLIILRYKVTAFLETFEARFVYRECSSPQYIRTSYTGPFASGGRLSSH